MLHFALLGILTIAGTVVDYTTGHPLANVPVAVAPVSEQTAQAMSGAQPSAGTTITVTDASGRFSVTAPNGAVLLSAYGENQQHVSYHGTFVHAPQVLTIRLIAPTAEERHALSEVNAFRHLKSIALHAAPLPELTFDENLMETARYWAAQESRAGLIGHTCATLRLSNGCTEFNTFFHALPGAPADDFSGQNAAFDSEPTWADSLGLFENEGIYCAPAYDWRRCGDGAEGSLTQTGHFKNLMLAEHWVGFGKVNGRSGSYFAQNVL